MKTINFNQRLEEITNSKKSIETEEHNLKGLFKEEFANLQKAFNNLVEKKDFEKANKIITFLSNNLFPQKEELLSNYPKEEPDLNKKGEFITDKKLWEGIEKFGKEYLTKETFQEIFQGIKWDREEEVLKGSKPKFIILTNMYLESINDKRKCLTAAQLWSNEELFKDKFWVDQGFYLNGENINSEEANYLRKQFEEKGVNFKEEFIPIKLDLINLELDKEGNFFLTDNAIWTQTREFQNGNFNFEEVNKFGINQKSECGTKNYVSSKEGVFRCCFLDGLDSDARDEGLGNSGPGGRVVLEIA